MSSSDGAFCMPLDPTEAPPAPRMNFTVTSYKDIKDDLGKHLFVVYCCRLAITYPRGCTKPPIVQSVWRRWSHVVLFDDEWAKIYPNLRDACSLPNGTSLATVFNKSKQTEARQQYLQDYFRQALEISALKEFVAQFMEMDFSLFTSKIVKVLAPLPAVEKAAPDADNHRASIMGGSAGGVRIITATGYVAEGVVQDVKGNTDTASKKAYRDKKRFEDANKDLLAQIMAAKKSGSVPTLKLNLPFLQHSSGSAIAPSPSPASSARFDSPSPVSSMFGGGGLTSPMSSPSNQQTSSGAALPPARPAPMGQRVPSSTPPPPPPMSSPAGPPALTNLRSMPPTLPMPPAASVTAPTHSYGGGGPNLPARPAPGRGSIGASSAQAPPARQVPANNPPPLPTSTPNAFARPGGGSFGGGDKRGSAFTQGRSAFGGGGTTSGSPSASTTTFGEKRGSASSGGSVAAAASAYGEKRGSGFGGGGTTSGASATPASAAFGEKRGSALAAGGSVATAASAYGEKRGSAVGSSISHTNQSATPPVPSFVPPPPKFVPPPPAPAAPALPAKLTSPPPAATPAGGSGPSAPAKQLNFCPECGERRVNANAKFCAFCGTKMS